MRKILLPIIILVFISGCNNSPKQAATDIPQAVLITGDSFYIVDDTSTYINYGLNAVYNGKIITIVDTSEHLYIRIDTLLDYDEDNDMDALISFSSSGGGNCCPDNYFLVTNEGNGKFIRSGMTESSWDPPVFEIRNGRPNFIVVSTNDGINNDNYEETIYRYIVNKGEIEITETKKTQEIPAIAEIRANEFSFDNEDEIKDLVFDLDNDQMNDTIRCSFWDRWGLIQPTFIFSTGLSDSSQISGKRIGVLSSETNGVQDLIINLNDTMRWNGKAYE